ncbi:hypothetical protein AOQ88_01175 [Candidatus Riesia sp. GBBU]|nr:hypothetical protein AOQ88_01175 [Candidatus Riesia sp. GBBU]
MHLKKFFLVYFLIFYLSGCVYKKNFFVPENNEEKLFYSIIWKNKIGYGNNGHYTKLSPFYYKGVAYSSDRSGIFEGIEIQTGNKIFSIHFLKKINKLINRSFNSLLVSRIFIRDDTLYLSTEIGMLISFNLLLDKINWIVELYGEILSDIVFSENFIFVHTNNDILYSLDLNYGNILWYQNLNEGNEVFSLRGNSSIAIKDNILFIGNRYGNIFSIEKKTGKIIWKKYIVSSENRQEIGWNNIVTTPLIDFNRELVFCISHSGNLFAIEIKSSRVVWETKTNSIHDMLMYKDSLFLVENNNVITSINLINGSFLWKTNFFHDRIISSMQLKDGCIVFGDNKGYIHEIDLNFGKIISSNLLDCSGFLGDLKVIEEKILIQSGNGNLYFLKKKSKL